MHVVSAEKRNWYYGLRNTDGGYLTKKLMARGLYTKRNRPIPETDGRANKVIKQAGVQGGAQKLKGTASLIKASSLAPVYRTPEKPPWMRLPAW